MRRTEMHTISGIAVIKPPVDGGGVCRLAPSRSSGSHAPHFRAPHYIEVGHNMMYDILEDGVL